MPDLLYQDFHDDYNGGRIETEYCDTGGNWLGVTYENPDGSGSWDMANGDHGSWNAPDPGYWQLGASLGIGFELWGTANGDMGFEWLVGVGVIANDTSTNTPGEALAAASATGLTVAHDVDPLPSTLHWDPNTGLTVDSVGINLGVYVQDQDPYTPAPPPTTPFNNDSPIP